MPKQASQLSQDYNAALAELWYAAAASPCGIELSVSDATQFIARAYRVRRQLGELSELGELMLKRSPIQPDKVWIVKPQQGATAPAAPAAEEPEADGQAD